MPPATSQPPLPQPPPPACDPTQSPGAPPPTLPLDHSATPPLLLPPAQADSIIDAATNPYLSLRDIAEAHDISLEQLTLFLDRPDIRERLAQIDTVTSRRTQSIAAACLHAVVKSLNRIVEAYLWEESKIVVSPTNFSQLEQRRRAAETIRRAGALLYRLSRPPAPIRARNEVTGPRVPRAEEQTRESSPSARENPGIPSLGPAPSDSEAVIPTPRVPSEPIALRAPDPDLALIRELARSRRTAAKVLHHLTGIPPEPEDDEEEEEEIDDTDQINDTEITAAPVPPVPSAQSPVPPHPGPAP
jgi:hypothetical protein